MEIISTLKELLHLHPLYNEQMRNFIQVTVQHTLKYPFCRELNGTLAPAV